MGVMGKVLAGEGGGDLGASAGPLRRVELGSKSILLRLDPSYLNADASSDVAGIVRQRLGDGGAVELDGDHVIVSVLVRVQVRRGMHQIAVLGAEPVTSFAQLDQSLVKAIVSAHAWLKMIIAGEVDSIDALARSVAKDRGYVRRMLGLAFMSPAIVDALVGGSKPLHQLTLAECIEAPIPTDWRRQAQQLRF